MYGEEQYERSQSYRYVRVIPPQGSNYIWAVLSVMFQASRPSLSDQHDIDHFLNDERMLNLLATVKTTKSMHVAISIIKKATSKQRRVFIKRITMVHKHRTIDPGTKINILKSLEKVKEVELYAKFKEIKETNYKAEWADYTSEFELESRSDFESSSSEDSDSSEGSEGDGDGDGETDDSDSSNVDEYVGGDSSSW